MSSISAPQWPEEPALFLDLDGTLLDFALDPSRVQVPDRLRGLLAQLPGATAGAIAFVSGRTLADLDRLLGPGQFPLAAVHGLERRNARGELSAATTDEEEFQAIFAALERISEAFPETLLEHKGVTLALHYRRCPELEHQLIEQVEETLDGMSTRLKLMRGKMVLEIKPSTGNKGVAIEAFMQEAPFAGRTPVFVGDDVTDEDGFRAVNELGGVSVKVGNGASEASFRLPDTQAVIAWIDELVSRNAQ